MSSFVRSGITVGRLEWDNDAGGLGEVLGVDERNPVSCSEVRASILRFRRSSLVAGGLPGLRAFFKACSSSSCLWTNLDVVLEAE